MGKKANVGFFLYKRNRRKKKRVTNTVLRRSYYVVIKPAGVLLSPKNILIFLTPVLLQTYSWEDCGSLFYLGLFFYQLIKTAPKTIFFVELLQYLRSVICRAEVARWSRCVHSRWLEAQGGVCVEKLPLFFFFFSNLRICVVFLHPIRGGAWADPRSSHVLFDTSAARCRLTRWGSSCCVLQRELLQQKDI